MQKTQAPTKPDRKLFVMTVITAILLLANIYMAFIYTPTEETMGPVQRIFYFHVGSAWAGGLAFAVTVYASIQYLRTRQRKWDIMGLSSVEVGMALLTMVIVSGPIWARYAWNVWWVWDAKLTSVAVMWLAYAAYLMLRAGIEDPDRRSRFGSVYGIVAFASVVMTYLGVRFVERTIHPAVVGPSAATDAEGDFGLAPRMLQAMLFSFFTFTVAYVTLLMYRMRLERLTDRVNAVKVKLFSAL